MHPNPHQLTPLRAALLAVSVLILAAVILGIPAHEVIAARLLR